MRIIILAHLTYPPSHLHKADRFVNFDTVGEKSQFDCLIYSLVGISLLQLISSPRWRFHKNHSKSIIKRWIFRQSSGNFSAALQDLENGQVTIFLAHRYTIFLCYQCLEKYKYKNEKYKKKRLGEQISKSEFLKTANSKCDFFQECQGLSLYSFLMLPMQRVTRWDHHHNQSSPQVTSSLLSSSSRSQLWLWW